MSQAWARSAPPVWVSVDYNSPRRWGPSFAIGLDIRALLRDAGCAATLLPVREPLERSMPDLARGVVLVVEERYPQPGYRRQPVGLRAALEQFGVRFTGSDSRAVLRSRDKGATKLALESAGLRVPRGAVLEDPPTATAAAERFLSDVGAPAVAKPITGRGGSIGVRYLADEAAVRRFVAQWRARRGRPYLIEAFIEGDEFTAWVLGMGSAVRCARIIAVPKGSRPLYDRRLKTGASRVLATARHIPALVSHRIERAAVSAHQALGAFSYSRVDLIVRGGQAVLLEVNTTPTLGSGALAPVSGTSRRLAPTLMTMIRHALRRDLVSPGV